MEKPCWISKAAKTKVLSISKDAILLVESPSTKAHGHSSDSSQGLLNGLGGEDFTSLELSQKFHDDDVFVFSHAHHKRLGIDHKSQPSIDSGEHSLFPTQGNAQSHICCQQGGGPGCGCALSQDPAEVMHKDKAPVNLWEDHVGQSEK